MILVVIPEFPLVFDVPLIFEALPVFIILEALFNGKQILARLLLIMSL